MNTETNFNLNDMYIEDSEMSFDMLEDGFSDDQISDASMGVENVEAEDLYEEDEVAEFDEIDEDESEEVEEGEEVLEDAEEVVEEELEEEEVDFEEYDVTLPNGETIKLHEAINGYKAALELQAEREAFEAEKTAFTTSNSHIKRMLDLAKLEADRVIEDYDGFDWATLSREDPQAYVENREFLDKYRARQKEIIKEMEHVENQLAQEKKDATSQKAAAANATLSKDIPGWNKEMYVDLMTYAVKNLGMEEEFVVNSVDAGFFKAIHMAKQMEQGKQAVKAKLKKIGGSPKKVVRAAPKAVKPVNSKKATITKRLEAGQFDEADLGMAFDMLED